MQVVVYAHQCPQVEPLLVHHTICTRHQSRQSVELTRCTMGEMLEYSKNF